MSVTSLIYLGFILFGSGGLVAIAAYIRKSGKDEVLGKQAKERADVAEKRLDIANKPSDSPDDTVKWLSGE